MKANIILFLLVPRVLSQSSKLEKKFLEKFHQNDYSVKPERAEVVRYNKEYVNKVEVRYFKYNRTCTAFNLTYNFKIDVGNDVEVIIQTYKFASNEYRLFPLRYQINACKAFDLNIFGVAGFTKCGNFTGCPLIKKKNYHVCNFVPDDKNLPPFIPSGSFKQDFQFLHASKELFTAAAYASVIRPEVKK